MGREEKKEERGVLDSIFPDEITDVSETEYRISIELEVTEPDESEYTARELFRRLSLTRADTVTSYYRFTSSVPRRISGRSPAVRYTKPAKCTKISPSRCSSRQGATAGKSGNNDRGEFGYGHGFHIGHDPQR